METKNISCWLLCCNASHRRTASIDVIGSRAGNFKRPLLSVDVSVSLSIQTIEARTRD